ncbi:hypothetical protein AX16_003623 [Volvariella volvacea WC 439]|nr:hypothetical protein AX16_003623 [Volvariella volvacea WC 439]
MSDHIDALLALEQSLLRLNANIRDANGDIEQHWSQVETAVQTIANSLRVHNTPEEDIRAKLGKTALPQTISSLFKLALGGKSLPNDSRLNVIYELLRVGANLCVEQEDNRAYLLEAQFPQEVTHLLESYAELLPPPPIAEAINLPLEQLKVIKTAFGTLLNMSVSHSMVKSRLNSLEAPLTILKLSMAIYPPGSWISRYLSGPLSLPEEEWTLRKDLSDWAWRAIMELKDKEDEGVEPISNAEALLPFLTPPLTAYLPPNSPDPGVPLPPDPSFIANLLQADFEVLENSCTILESLSLDVEEVRASLARGYRSNSEHKGVPCLATILEFVEHGTFPAVWSNPAFGPNWKSRKEKSFGICKGALVKAVVEVAGERGNIDALWDNTDTARPGGVFVEKMVNWIKRYTLQTESIELDQPTNDQAHGIHRDDLVICASLSLGNLASREGIAKALLSPPYSLASTLTSPTFWSPNLDLKLRHGILGLLRNLAQASINSQKTLNFLRTVQVVQLIVASGIWDDKADFMLDVVQLNAIVVVKHILNGSVEQSVDFVLGSKDGANSKTGLEQVLALAKRSDSVPIKSEGTRVLVNVVKALWSSAAAANTALSQEKRRTAMEAVLSSESADALSNFIGRSGKFPLLINEGIVAMSLLSTTEAGAKYMLEALASPLTGELSQSGAQSSSSPHTGDDIDSTKTTRTAFNQILSVLKNSDNNYRPEMRINVCSLIQQLGKNAPGPSFTYVQQKVRPVIENLVKVQPKSPGPEELLNQHAKKLLESWV